MPAQTARGEVLERPDLPLRFLHLVLAEVDEPRLERLAHGGRRKGLADRDERHVLGRPARAGRRPGDALPDGGDATGDHFLGLSAVISPSAVALFCAFVGFMARYFSRYCTASVTLFWPTMSVPRW